MTDLSEYERERLARIQDNQKFLQSLGLGFEKKNGIFTEDVPKKEKFKKKKINEDFVPRRSSRARHSTGSPDDDGSQQLDELNIDYDWEEKKQKKKHKDTGVRVVWGRTYDPINGTTCHQCRQKTLELKVACTNLIEDYHGKKQMCNVKLDEACLVNRYGQTIEAALASGEWKCPKCLARSAGFESVDSYLRSGPPSTKKFGRPRKETTNQTIPKLILPNIYHIPSFLPSYDALISPDSSEYAAMCDPSFSPSSTDSLIFSDASFPSNEEPYTPNSTSGYNSDSTPGFSQDSSLEFLPDFDQPTTPYKPPTEDQLCAAVDNALENMIGKGETKLKPIRITLRGTAMIIDDSPSLPFSLPLSPVHNNVSAIEPASDARDGDKSYGPNDYAPDEFDVEKILDMEVVTVDGKDETYFLVKWKGVMENTWEPKGNLYCHRLVELFLRKRRAQKHKEKNDDNNNDKPQKKVSPKRKKKDKTSKSGKKMKAEQVQAPEASSVESTPGKRANRGNRSAQFSDYQFF